MPVLHSFIWLNNIPLHGYSAFYLPIPQLKINSTKCPLKVLKVEALIFLWRGENHLCFITGRGNTHDYEDHHPAYVPVGIFLCSASKYQDRDV